MLKQRIIHLEVMRILALFCIVYNHIGYVLFMSLDNPIKITVSIVISILCKIGVPLFFMISGALLLGKEETWQEVYKKRVLRIAIVIVLFTVLRFFYECYIKKTMNFSVVQLVKSILTGNILHPYWFLYAYLSILLILPILRMVIKILDEQGMKNLLLLIILFHMIIPLKALVVKQEWQVSLLIDEKICYMFLGYFIEHKLQRANFTSKNMIFAFVGSVIGIILSVGMVANPYFGGGEYATEMIPVLSMFLAGTYFYLIRGFSFSFTNVNARIQKCISTMGSCVFGVYLIEDYLRAILGWIYQRYGVYTNYIRSNLFSTAIVVITGIAIIYLWKKVPVLKRLL